MTAIVFLFLLLLFLCRVHSTYIHPLPNTRIHSNVTFWMKDIWERTMISTNKILFVWRKLLRKKHVFFYIGMCKRMRQSECVMSYDLRAYLNHWASESGERTSGFFILSGFYNYTHTSFIHKIYVPLIHGENWANMIE